MTINDYLDKITVISFEEFPDIVFGHEMKLQEIIDFGLADLKLKIHLAEVVICRCFPVTGGICFHADSKWFITEFLLFYKKDIPKPWLTSAIKEAIMMILSDDTFTKRVIATTFMFGVVKFYAKHFLGYKPMQYDFFDNQNHRKFRKVFIGDAFNKLKRTKIKIAESLNKIDKHSIKRLKNIVLKKTVVHQQKLLIDFH